MYMSPPVYVTYTVKYMGHMVSKEEETSGEYLSHFKQLVYYNINQLFGIAYIFRVVKEYLESATIQPSLCIYVAG